MMLHVLYFTRNYTSCIEALDKYEAVITSIQTTDTVIRAKNMEVLQLKIEIKSF